MSLNSSQRKILKRKAQKFKPKLNIGKNGLGDENIKSLNKLLSDQSLIKIKILGDKSIRSQMIEKLNEMKICEVVGSIGSSVILYKKNQLDLLKENSTDEEIYSE